MILLVEDDEDVREMLEVALRGRGYVIESVASGAAALEALQREKPCLMILDMVMPGVTGWDVLAEMKARGIDVPVCVISALSDSAPPEGVIASLVKPFDMRALAALADRFCAHTRA